MLDRVLYIVARARTDLYLYLRRLAEADGIPVVLDRRGAQRRKVAARVGAERRQAERRVKDVSADLESTGWTIVDVEENYQE